MSKLDSTGEDWVEQKIKADFELSRAVNSVLLGKKGVPDMPTEERVNRLAQDALTREQVKFMMDAKQGETPIFTYQTKLVSPSERIDLLSALLDGQPKTMGTADRPLRDASIACGWEFGKKHLVARPSRVSLPTWYWEFGQGDQIIDLSMQARNSRLVSAWGKLKSLQKYACGADRSVWATRMQDCESEWESLRNLPTGMRGTERYTWATRMATGLRGGKPLDINDAQISQESEHYYTALDEEREFTTDGDYSPLFCGSFDPIDRRAKLTSAYSYGEWVAPRLRLSIDGSTA